MIMTPPRSTRTYTLFPYTTLFRSEARDVAAVPCVHGDDRCPAVDDVSVAVGIREAQDAAGRLRRRTHDRELARRAGRSEEHTSELQSLMRISYAVFCLKKKKKTTTYNTSRLITHIIDTRYKD